VGLNRNALEVSRKLKPEIPQIGYDGIPLRDEVELEMILDSKISPTSDDKTQAKG